MNQVLRALWRAVGGMAHPRVLWLTAAPFFISAAIWGGVFWYAWEWAVALVRQGIDQVPALASFASSGTAMTFIGVSGLHLVLAPFLVIALAVPLIVATILVVIGATSMPAVVRHLGHGRYSHLRPLRGGGMLGSMVYALATTAVFIILMIISVPLWLIPPFFAIAPPLLWGWLTYKVMSYDALAEHASATERRALIRQHRWPLLAIGVVTGLLGTLPAMIWASSLIAIVLFPLIAVIAVWLYVFIFVFSALWFTHYCLAALETLREQSGTLS